MSSPLSYKFSPICSPRFSPLSYELSDPYTPVLPHTPRTTLYSTMFSLVSDPLLQYSLYCASCSKFSHCTPIFLVLHVLHVLYSQVLPCHTSSPTPYSSILPVLHACSTLCSNPVLPCSSSSYKFSDPLLQYSLYSMYYVHYTPCPCSMFSPTPIFPMLHVLPVLPGSPLLAPYKFSYSLYSSTPCSPCTTLYSLLSQVFPRPTSSPIPTAFYRATQITNQQEGNIRKNSIECFHFSLL